MNPMTLTNATRTLAKDQPEYISLDIFDEVTETGVPTMSSLWTPTKKELRMLNEGGAVQLSLLGVDHPPVFLGVQALDPENIVHDGSASND